MLEIWVNGQQHSINVEPEMPLLWVLRDELGLTGTKYGCGIGQCGACTVHVNGEARRSCLILIGGLQNAKILTVEGLSSALARSVQRAWIAHDVPQCGYCQSGQIMAAVAFLAKTPDPSDAQIEEAITNICRCGTYPRIRAAIHSAAKLHLTAKE
jgi:isoquinoline 1-oxidoreductase subunit alpha